MMMCGLNVDDFWCNDKISIISKRVFSCIFKIISRFCSILNMIFECDMTYR